MKTLLLLTLVFLANFCVGQKNYYYQNNGKSLKSRAEAWSEYENIIRMNKMRANSEDSTIKSVTEPVIYHKEIKGDTIINYYEIRSYFGNKQKESESDFGFRQDPMFLYLNKKLPDFKLTDINGNEFSLDQIKGKPALLNFSAIYCRACMEEIPRLNQLKKLYKDDVNFIAIFDVERNPGDVEKTIIKHPFDFLVLRNTEAFKNQLNIQSLPYNIFIGKDGFVINIQRGYHYRYGTSCNNYFTRTIDELIK